MAKRFKGFRLDEGLVDRFLTLLNQKYREPYGKQSQIMNKILQEYVEKEEQSQKIGQNLGQNFESRSITQSRVEEFVSHISTTMGVNEFNWEHWQKLLRVYGRTSKNTHKTWLKTAQDMGLISYKGGQWFRINGEAIK